jgi:O-antigen polymerase
MNWQKQGYIWCIILFAIFFFIFFPDTTQTFSSNFYFKYLIFTLTILAFVVLLSGALLYYKWPNAIGVYFSGFDFLVLIYLSYYLFNYYNKGSIYFDSLPAYLTGLLLIVIFRQFNLSCSKIPSVLLIYFLITLFVQAGYGILQSVGILNTTHSRFAITGSFNNQGIYGIWLSIMFPFSIAGLKFRASKVQRYLCFFVGSCALVAIYLSFSRTAWIAVFASTLYSYRRPVRQYFLNRKKTIRYSILSLIAFFFLSVLWGVFNMKKDSAIGRLFIWKIGISMFSSHPVSGLGPGGFERDYGAYLSNFFERENCAKTDILLSERVDYAFNDYLQLYIEEGIVGGSLFIIILFNAFYTRNRNPIVEAAQAALVALAIGCLFSYPLEDPFIWISFILIIACASHGIAGKYYTIPLDLFRICLVLIIIVSGLAIVKQLQIYRAKKESFQAINKVWNNDTTSISIFKKIYPVLKYDYTMMLSYARILTENKQFNESNRLIQESKKLICDPFMYITEGDNYLGMSDFVNASTSYKKAISIDPKLIYPRYKIAKLYMRQQDTVSACNIAEEILHLDIKVKSSATDNIQAEMLGITYLCK